MAPQAVTKKHLSKDNCVGGPRTQNHDEEASISATELPPEGAYMDPHRAFLSKMLENNPEGTYVDPPCAVFFQETFF